MPRIPETQREAYDDLIPKLGEKRAVVYLAICNRPSTLFEIQARLGWPINCISGRVTELKDRELIEERGRRQNPNTGKWGIVWGKATKDQKQPDLFPCDLDQIGTTIGGEPL